MTILYRGLLSGQYIYWNSNQATPGGASDIVKIGNTEMFKYPDIDANTIVAWTFNGLSGNILNTGTAGSNADMTTIESGVVRNVSGGVSSGISYDGSLVNTRVYTPSGATNIGSSNFTSSITCVAFFSLASDPTTGPARRIFLKGYDSTWGGGGIYQGSSIEFTGTSLYGIVQTAAGFRAVQATLASANDYAFGLGFRPHMVAFTYGTESGTSVGKIYYDGVLIARTSFGSQSDCQIGNIGNEGPWNVGGLYANIPGFYDGINGVMYHARAENVVRNADWIRNAWNDFVGQ